MQNSILHKNRPKVRRIQAFCAKSLRRLCTKIGPLRTLHKNSCVCTKNRWQSGTGGTPGEQSVDGRSPVLAFSQRYANSSGSGPGCVAPGSRAPNRLYRCPVQRMPPHRHQRRLEGSARHNTVAHSPSRCAPRASHSLWCGKKDSSPWVATLPRPDAPTTSTGRRRVQAVYALAGRGR